MAELLTNGAFNINRGNYEGAYEVAGIVLETREQLKRLFHAADSRSVIFSPGITYSLNYFIPVSYTHLDVYKRQIYIHGVFRRKGQGISNK